MEDNVAWEAATFLLTKILDLDDDFWAAFCYEGWDTFRLQLALDTFLLIAAAIWWRVVQLLKTYPWALWLAVDLAEPMEKRRRRCQEIKECCQFCVDREFTAPFLQGYNVDDLLVEGSDANRLVTESIHKCRATNIMSEFKFSRIIKHMMSSVFGRAADAFGSARRRRRTARAGLDRRDRLPSVTLGRVVELRDLPRPVVAAADVPNPSRADQVFHRPQRLLQRHRAVGQVQVI